MNKKAWYSSRSWIISTSITFVLILLVVSTIYYLGVYRYKSFAGNWEMVEITGSKANPEIGYYLTYCITNLSIVQSNTKYLIVYEGINDFEPWGPLASMAKRNNGTLVFHPEGNYLLSDRQESSFNFLSQPFEIYYCSRYDYLVMNNILYKRSKKSVEW